MFQLILATTFIIGVFSAKHVVIQFNNLESPVSPKASPAIQFLTPGDAVFPDGVFYDVEDKFLSYVDVSGAILLYMDIQYGESGTLEITQAEGSGHLAFVYAQNGDKDKFVMGSGNALISTTAPSSFLGINTLATVPVTNDTGYEITKGHADKNGNLFLALNSKADKKHRGGRLYKFIGKVPMLVKQFTGDVMDFAWGCNCTSLYVIKDSGKTIVQYNYDITKQTICGEKVVFRLPYKFKKSDIMTGIETNDLGCLWVTVSGCGKLMEIHNGKIMQIIKLPSRSLTGLTAGGKDNKGLFVSTSKLCEKDPSMSGGILYVSGINGTGATDYFPKW